MAVRMGPLMRHDHRDEGSPPRPIQSLFIRKNCQKPQHVLCISAILTQRTRTATALSLNRRRCLIRTQTLSLRTRKRNTCDSAARDTRGSACECTARSAAAHPLAAALVAPQAPTDDVAADTAHLKSAPTSQHSQHTFLPSNVLLPVRRPALPHAPCDSWTADGTWE